MRLPTRRTIMCAMPLLILCAAASGERLRDSGYGDGSLVDAQGHYYYPQPNGGYVDTYGTAYNPLGDGLYGDAIGNLIDAGPDAPPPAAAAKPSGGTPLRESKGRSPARTAAQGPRPSGVPPAAAAADDTAAAPDPGEFGPRYLEEVGDGYLTIDPAELAADPRLDAPMDAAAPPLDAAEPSGASPQSLADTADPMLEFGLEDTEGPAPTPANRTLDLSLPDPRTTGPSRSSGPVKNAPQRLRPDD